MRCIHAIVISRPHITINAVHVVYIAYTHSTDAITKNIIIINYCIPAHSLNGTTITESPTYHYCP